MDVHCLKETVLELIEKVDQQAQVFNREKLSFQELKEKFSDSLEDSGDGAKLQRFFSDFLKYSINTAHPLFDNQLFSGVEYPAVIGDLLTSLTNTTMATFESSPVGTILEKQLIEKLNYKIGYQGGDGLMVSGGSQANTQAMLCARQKVVPEYRSAPEKCKPMRVFVSEDAHYSFKKSALIMGMGDHGVVKVPVKDNHQMDPDALEERIKDSLQRGEQPIMVGATMGTTVYGAFDNLEELAEVCEKYKIWLHADGAWGAPAFFSKRFTDQLKGAEKADSWTWDAHKLMSASLTNTLFLTRHSTILFETNNVGDGRYIFHQDPGLNIDIGPKSLQCGRRAQGVSLWVQWLIEGDVGFQRKLERLDDLKKYFLKKIESLPELELISDPVFLNLCFRYLPKNKKINPNKLNKQVRQELIRRGLGMVNFYTDKEGKVFFRYIFANSLLNESTIDGLVDDLMAIAREFKEGI